MYKIDAKEYIKYYEDLMKYCEKHSLGDPFSSGRGREIYMAFKLGHRISPTLAGADAYDKRGKPVEYKSTIQDIPRGYGYEIVIKDSFEKTMEYLEFSKIKGYTHHFYAVFSGSTIKECWRLTGNQTFNILRPKVENLLRMRFSTRGSLTRFQFKISHNDVIQKGKRII